MQLSESSSPAPDCSKPVIDLAAASFPRETPVRAMSSQDYSALFVHKKSRQEAPSDYPARFPVSDACADWNVSFPEYAPPYFVTPKVIEMERTAANPTGWADPEDFSRLISKEFRSHVKPIECDENTGHPFNPMGRTGIAGRGRLGAWGANFAGDAIVTRENPDTGAIEIAIITRKNGQKAIPGGMVDRGENSFHTTLREFREETDGDLTQVKCEFIEKIFEGYVDDYRNTDNAWMETTAYHFHVPRSETHKLVLTAKDDAAGVEWMPFVKGGFPNLFASHGMLVERAIELMERRGLEN